MKKTVLCAVALVAASAASAQTGEITSNRGENWLSQDGDWGLTFDAQPLLNYAGNLFNNGNNTGVAALNNLWNTDSFLGINGNQANPGGSNVVIGVKKLVDANTAYRGKVRIGFGSTKETELVNDVTSTANPPAQVEDVTKNSYMAVNLGVGLEKRVGSTRVVGIYGGEFNIGFGNSKTVYEYGNAISANNPVAGRNTEEKHGSVFGLGLNGFVGVEWFAAPKISLSGEYTWGLSLRSKGHTETSAEGWNGTGVETQTVEAGTKRNQFSLDTGVSGASIGVNFYFQ